MSATRTEMSERLAAQGLFPLIKWENIFNPLSYEKISPNPGDRIIFLISNRSPLFNLNREKKYEVEGEHFIIEMNSFDCLAVWCRKAGFTLSQVISTGYLQRHSIVADKISMRGSSSETLDLISIQYKADTEAEKKEITTINKILSAFTTEDFSCVRYKSTRDNQTPPVNSAEYQRMLVAVKKLEKEANIRLKKKGDFVSVPSSLRKEDSKWRRESDQITQIVGRDLRGKTPKILINHTGRVKSEGKEKEEKNKEEKKEERVVEIINWSAVLNTQSYQSCQASYEKILKENKEEQKKFDDLIEEVLQARLLLSQEKQSSQQEKKSDPEITRQIKKLTERYIIEEFPMIQDSITNSIKRYLETGQTTYFAYPIRTPVGYQLLQYAAHYFIHLLRTYPNAFKFVDTTGLLSQLQLDELPENSILYDSFFRVERSHEIGHEMSPVVLPSRSMSQ